MLSLEVYGVSMEIYIYFLNIASVVFHVQMIIKLLTVY